MDTFDKDFLFGTATSSYQIEGAHNIDGKAPSIWDTFSHTKGKIIDGSNGDIACDHYHLFQKDIDLMVSLGIDVYRFSISWPRIMPEKGIVNKDGIAFYRKLAKALKKAGIKLSVTMYHWDLPQWIYDENKGWPHRDTVDYFVEYAEVLLENLDDLVDQWITFNEPWCSSYLGYYTGEHAPGHKNTEEYVKAHHHLLLAHGKTIKRYRELNYNTDIGITLNTSHTYTNSDRLEDEMARKLDDGFRNRFFYDPLFKGNYPQDILVVLSQYIKDWSFIQSGDLEIISQKMDILGINFYSRSFVKFNKEKQFYFEGINTSEKKTSMGWDITPYALKDLIIRLREDYTDLPVYITENGSAWNDIVVDGQIVDEDRIDYLNKHLEVVRDLNNIGMNIKGYYVWSLIDNFEWAEGYTQLFGLIHCNFDTLDRIPKKSFYRYQEIIKNRSL